MNEHVPADFVLGTVLYHRVQRFLIIITVDGGGRDVGLCRGTFVRVRGQSRGVVFLLLPLCGLWRSNSEEGK